MTTPSLSLSLQVHDALPSSEVHHSDSSGRRAAAPERSPAFSVLRVGVLPPRLAASA